MTKGGEVELDEDLHSRQLAVYGRETMRRLAGAHVLIAGLKGLGVEVAKNVILAGVKSVTLQDVGSVEKRDLGAQFYLTEEDVGKNRAEACRAKLQELNTAVTVETSTVDLTEDFVCGFQAVLLTDSTLDNALRLNDACHKHDPPVPFIKADTRGVFANVFCDFGSGFTVYDVDGEEPHKGIVASISNDSPALVTCVDDERLEFQDGELVTFSEVKGMPELNTCGPVRIKGVKAHSFFIEVDTTNFGQYERGGLVLQVKESVTRDFKSLREGLKEPGEFLLSDFAKLDRPPMLHLAFQALDQFQVKNKRLPAPGNAADGDEIVALTKALNTDNIDLDEAILKKFASGASGDLSPMAAMFGGIVGQEVVKACTGKFHPLFQFFYFDSLESIPAEILSPEEYAPQDSRYDSQIAVFGRSIQEKIQKMNVFLVGAGALGCEFVKNMACMGIACKDGKVTLTDDDIIEKSNLSRQFLFRDWDIKQPKSTVAAKAALAINPALNITALQERVSPDTETVFDDDFWDGLDVVVNALDNVNARLYVDSRCVYFQRPLLESGTLGTKCNTQMVIPEKTENYGASRDPPEKQAPMCTLHSFPFIIDHCLAWARSEFEGLYEKTPSEAVKYLSKPSEVADAFMATPDAATRETVEKVLDFLVTKRLKTYTECVSWARRMFQEYFFNKISQLTFTFPEDAKTSTGALFWSAPKRFPSVVKFSTSNPSHLMFVRAGANLMAEAHGVDREELSDDALAALINSVQIEDFVPKSGVKIETDPKATASSAGSMDDETIIADMLKKLEEGTKDLVGGSHKIAPISFEKDDDTNFHMDFITAMANMRAVNYQITEVDKLQAKLIAGRIIPAIATTTAMATGLVCLDLYKLLLDSPIEAYRNTFANLALPLFAMAEPIPPKYLEYNNMKWSLWDRWIIEGDVTVQELLDYFEERKLTAYSVSCGQSLIYNNFFPKHKERLPKKMSTLVQEISKLEIPPKRRHFDVVVAVEDEQEEDLDIPLISIRFR
eukprot:CAMPEP_0197849798 /NCGR_PEP_ID=MMETSP1438-20131217/13250_1 /TAXON_ID=1461541 /ORGANISM="Pterosperma sp., Strain CCMP1384" /LENGTH=1008 /DNA_ID=CAMNT_0043462637 /DNA_START=225 /DNA_END=3251 /DNA_ORIENTATION=+